VAQPGLASGQFSVHLRRLGGGRLADPVRGPQPGPDPVGAVGVPLLNRPDERPCRLREPVLQVAASPADLAAHQARGLAAQVLPGRPPAELAGKPAPDGPGEQLGLPPVLAGGVEEPPVRGQPALRLRDGEIQAEQLGR
jgi:hypothetical protein